jgi:hypothetical protein
MSRVRYAKKFFKDINKIHDLLNSGRTNNFVPVKVAILDTGIRQSHRLRQKLAGYYDFVDAKFVEEETPARDDTGHGSDMVELLYKTAPWASIYVGRVFTNNTGDLDTTVHVAKVSNHPLL